MRFLCALGMIWLSGVVHADCLKQGVTPARIVFADGAVIDGISRESNTLRYTSHPSQTEVATMEALWGIYQMRSTYKGVGTSYAWNTETLPPPSDLVPGQTVEHLAESVAPSGDVRSHAFAVRLVEKTEITVGGCRYPVLLLETRWGTADGARSEGLRWYDPDRLVTWATEIRIFKEDGSVDRELSSRAVSAD